MLYWLACRYKQQSNNSTPEPVRLISAWEGDSPAFSMYIVTASFFHDPEQLPGWWDPTDPDPNPCGHWYPLISKGLGPGDLQILVTWYQSTPRNYSNWIQEERKKKRSSQHVWCSACWTCGPPEAWQMLNWGIYVPFCFSMKVNLHLYVHFLLYCTF